MNHYIYRVVGGLFAALVLIAVQLVQAQTKNTPTIACEVLRRYNVPEVKQFQGVTVDKEFLYVFGTREFAKCSYSKDKDACRVEMHWRGPKSNMPPVYLGSGVVHDGRLYCARSNFPEVPPISTVEIWDTEEMKHVDCHSFGIQSGWLTWVDWHDGAWWGVIANDTENANDNPAARDTRWTSLVRFDDQWRQTGGWVFPSALIERFQPHSCSGGAWGPNGRLYCTGEERGEVYELLMPIAGATLIWTATYTTPITGGGIAWDSSQPGVFYGIDRAHQQVNAAQVPTKQQPAQVTPPAATGAATVERDK